MTLKSQCVQLVSNTGIESVFENLISVNRPHHLSEPKCRFSIQRLSLIYLVKEQLAAETSEQHTSVCSSLTSLRHRIGGGATRDRTADLLNANQALSQLSYSPIFSNGRPGQI